MHLRFLVSATFLNAVPLLSAVLAWGSLSTGTAHAEDPPLDLAKAFTTVAKAEMVEVQRTTSDSMWNDAARNAPVVDRVLRLRHGAALYRREERLDAQGATQRVRVSTGAAWVEWVPTKGIARTVPDAEATDVGPWQHRAVAATVAALLNLTQAPNQGDYRIVQRGSKDAGFLTWEYAIPKPTVEALDEVFGVPVARKVRPAPLGVKASFLEARPFSHIFFRVARDNGLLESCEFRDIGRTAWRTVSYSAWMLRASKTTDLARFQPPAGLRHIGLADASAWAAALSETDAPAAAATTAAAP